MRNRAALALALFLLAAGACVIAAAHVLRGTRVGSEGVPGARALAARLAALDEDVRLTWFASAPASWEGEYRHLEPALHELFETLEQAAPARVHCARLDPASDPALAAHAAALGLAPFRARTVERDGWRETTLWSSLRIVIGARGAATIEGLSPEKLPGLAELVEAQVAEILAPRKPRILLEAPMGYGALERELARAGDLVRGDFDSSGRFAIDADLVFWIEPARVRPEQLAALRELLARGKSVVLAGSAFRPRATNEAGAARLAFEPTGYPAADLLREFGLVPDEELLVETADPAHPEAGARPEQVRSIGANQDFRRLRGQPNGTLLFRAPTSFAPDPARLAELGLAFRVLASSSEHTGALAPSATPRSAEELAAAAAKSAHPHATLCALLEPLDPWRGPLVVLGAATPFQDEFLEQEAFAHRALVEILARTLASSERLASARVAELQPPGLGELSGAQRGRARLWVVGALPCALALPWLTRRARAWRRTRRAGSRAWRALLLALAGLVCVGLVRAVLPASASLDLTREGAHALAPELVALLREAASPAQPLHARLCFSSDALLPAEYRPEFARTRELLDRLASTTGCLALEEERFDTLDAQARAHLESLQLRSLRVTSQRDENLLVRHIVAALVLERGERRELLEFPDSASFEDLGFRIGFAIERLRTGQGVRIAAACDRPSLSPAESHLDFEARHLFAPSGGDVYARARELLAAHDFELESISGSAPVPQREAQLFLWLQPRRDIEPLLHELEAELARGGKALVAAQHFVVRPRAKSEHANAQAWWPEPQFCDLEHGWLADQGVELAREVFFDELASSAELEQKIDREAGGRRAERTASANPLLVRAVAAGFDANDPFTRALGDLVLPFANRIRLDAPKLARAGLAAHTLVRSSSRTWSLDWKGGDLAPESFVAQGKQLLGEQALAAEISGRFALTGHDADPSAPSGKLVLVGCSEMFQNDWIERAGSENGRFLVQAAAALTLRPELAALLARRTSTQGFGWIEPGARSWLRAGTIACAPLLLVCFACGWTFVRRRKRAEVAR